MATRSRSLAAAFTSDTIDGSGTSESGGPDALQTLHAEFAQIPQDSEGLRDVIALCKVVALHAPSAMSSLTEQCKYLRTMLDLPGLSRWIQTGLRLYQRDSARLGGYFRLEDPIAVRSLSAEAKGSSLASVQMSLQYFLAGFCMADIEIKARKQESVMSLPIRAVLSDQVFLLPEYFLAIEGAEVGDIYTATLAHAIAHLRHSRLHQSTNKRKPLLIAVLSLIEDARVERLMGQQYPGLYALWGRFHTASGEKNDLTVASLTARLARAIHDASYEDPNHWVNKGRDLFEACVGRLDDVAAFIEVGSILANDLGQMRVQFVPQKYYVEPAYRDDNTVLWDFGSDSDDAPEDEVLARNAVQIAADDTRNMEAVHIAPLTSCNEERYNYPEWDCYGDRMRENWTTVFDVPVPWKARSSDVTMRRWPADQRLAFSARARLLDRAVRLRRQHEGDDIDLDGAIESRISVRGRMMPDPRVFQRPGKRRRNLTVLLLLDLSESTNDRIGGSFTSILDLEKQAADALALSIDPDRDRIAIAGFASNGRSEVHFTRIKNYDDEYGDEQRRYLQAQRGGLSTRIGAALRHASSCLKTDLGEKKILFVITDGEPSDIDVSDRDYLVQDARHAVNDLTVAGIDTFCITLDKSADNYVQTIFGAWNYLIIDNARSLPFQITQAIEKVAAR